MTQSAEDVQRRRLAHRLHAVYMAEMSGKGQVDPLYRKLREKDPLEVFAHLADVILAIFHDIFLAQMSQRVRAQVKVDAARKAVYINKVGEIIERSTEE